MRRREILGALATAWAGAATSAWAAPSARVQAFATRRGFAAYEMADRQGGPFTSALIDTLARPPATAEQFFAQVRARTLAASEGKMTPEWSACPSVRLFEKDGREKRSALVLAFSAYPGRPPAMPSAAYDAARLADALIDRGFEVDLGLDLTKAEAERRLALFRGNSAGADLGLVFCIGHGLAVSGRQYVAPLEFDLSRGENALEGAWGWDAFAAAPQSRRLNVAIWAGCRDNPFNWGPSAAA